MSETGYVSLVQFQPDAARLESANVGLILYSPITRRIEVKMLAGVGHVHRFFGKEIDPEFLNDMKRALAARVKAESKAFNCAEDFAQFGHRLGNQLVMTPPRGVAINEPLEKLIERLFVQWVAEPPKKPVKRSALGRRVKGFFDKLPNQDKIRRDENVQLPEIDSVQVPFTYLNGRLNLVKPISLSEKCQDEARSWLLVTKLLKTSMMSTAVDIILARADSEVERNRRAYCEKVLTTSNANLFFEEGLDKFENHVKTALLHA